MKFFDTIIFDLDGTLLDTADDFTNSLNYCLKKHSLPQRTREQAISYVGNGSKTFVQRALPKNCDLLDQIYEEYKAHYRENVAIFTKPYEGIMSMLNELCSMGMKIAIVSNKPDNGVKALNEKFFSDYIKIAIGDTPGISIKPNDGTLKLALNELGSISEKTIYVGDSEVDVMTSRNAGMKHIAVTWGFRTKEQLVQAGAQTLAAHPRDIVEIVKTINK